MCDPLTATVVTMAAATAVSTYGMYQSSKAQKAQAQYQSAVANNNKIIAERNADEIEKQGKKDANRYRAKVRQISAEQTVGFAGQGVDVTEGSSVDLLADTAELGELDAQTIEKNANRQAYNTRVQGMNYGAQAGLYQNQANSINTGFSAGTTFLQGASSVANTWSMSPRTTGGA